MNHKIIISPATMAHVSSITALTKESITQLCAADHANNPQILAEWLENKTELQMQEWINNPNHYVIIAELNGKLAGMAGANFNGRILRNYVHPKHRFKGVSKAMMANLETFIKTQNHKHATLESSKTAKQFYLKQGWQLVNPNDETIEMIKLLMK